MNMPGFSAKSSLGPTQGNYRANAAFGRSDMSAVMPMALCCASTNTKSLRVTFPHTKCAPLRDFILATNGDTVFKDVARSTRQSIAQGSESVRFSSGEFNTVGETVFDQRVCMTSRGPWNATLTETRSCSDSTPVQSLVINAYGDQMSFVWQGGVELHPPSVGLVSCRQDHQIQTPCGGLSTCECISTFCPPTAPCDCGLAGIW